MKEIIIARKTVFNLISRSQSHKKRDALNSFFVSSALYYLQRKEYFLLVVPLNLLHIYESIDLADEHLYVRYLEQKKYALILYDKTIDQN